ncbi:hypothetical protein ACFL6S_16070 [Candidatus Poribacteria bacterium]
MRREVEQAIRKFYDAKDSLYVSPIAPGAKWRYKHAMLKETRAYIPPLIEEIRNRFSGNIRMGNALFSSGSGYYYSEQVIVNNVVILMLSWLGPFGNYDSVSYPSAPKEGAEKIKRELRKILEQNNVIILSNEEIGEPVDWLDPGANPFVHKHLPVWNCLFCEH